MSRASEPPGNDPTITLATRPARATRVTAAASDGTLGGNLLAAPGASITWRAEADGAAYLVTFRELTSGRVIWPFQGEPSCMGGDGPYLRVTQACVTVVLDGDAPDEIKYEVKTEASGDDVDPLDPMIIIRPPRA